MALPGGCVGTVLHCSVWAAKEKSVPVASEATENTAVPVSSEAKESKPRTAPYMHRAYSQCSIQCRSAVMPGLT